jgi:mono/diheme cytochrome c family protein
MNNTIRSSVVLIAFAALAGAVGFSQSSGEAIYKQKCLTCHGADGLANSGIGKVMRVKPITDPQVKKLSETEMIELTGKGVGKMQAYKGDLTDAQIKASVDYLRGFIK